MSDQEPFPNCSAQFPGTPSSSHSQQRLLSPVSHYRELFATGRKRRRVSHGPLISAQQYPVQPGPIELAQVPPATNKSWPACRADAATYMYNFAQDFAISEDIIESDATDDCSDCEPPALGEDAEHCPSPQRQASRIAKRQLGDLKGDGPPQEATQDSKSDHENDKKGIPHRNINRIHVSPLPALTSDSSKGILSASGWESNVTPESSPPLLESENKSSERGLVEDEGSRGRQPSPQLGNTPRSIREEHRGSSPTGFQHKEQGFEEPDLKDTRQPLLALATRVQSSQRIESSQSAIEEVLVESRQIPPPEPPASDESTQSIVRIDCGSLSASKEEDDDSILKYTISDALLAMHKLMSKSFWANDHQWLAQMALPVPRSQPCTPYSDEIIKTSAKLIETIDSIKTKEGNSKQARFADVLSYRISSFIGRIREACSTMCHHLFGTQPQNPHQRPHIHEETVHRMRKYAIPRLVAVLGKAFTLLCNPKPEMRSLAIFVTEQICFDTERILKIIEFGTELSEDGVVVEVEEFVRCLAVVREWAKVERDMKRASRSIAL